jgi:heme exporter protein D
MGGYGAYIWPAYGVAAVVMLGLLWNSIHTSRVHQRELAELEASGRTRRRRTGSTPAPVTNQVQTTEDRGNDPQAS